MRLRLEIAREVEVDIRLLIAVEAEEGLERNIVSVAYKRLAAYLAVFRRQVKTRAYRAVHEEGALLAVLAQIVRHKRVDLGYLCGESDEGRAYGASRADIIAVIHGEFNKSLGDDIEHGVTVFDNGTQLLFEALFDIFRQRIAVDIFYVLIAYLAQLLIRAGYSRRICAVQVWAG